MAITRKIAPWDPRLLHEHEDSAEVGWVTIAECRVDPTYQRPLDERRVAEYVEHYDPHQVEIATISRRADGSMWIINGQHTFAMLRALGKSVALARVLTGLTVEREAELYERLNSDRVAPTTYDHWRARLGRHEAVAVAIQAKVEAHGFEISLKNSRQLGRITALSAIERIYEWDPRLLDFALDMLRRCWQTDMRARDGMYLQALAVFRVSWPDFLQKRFDEVFSRTPANEVLQTATRLRIEQGVQMRASVIAVAMRDLYNRQLRLGRLEGPPIAPQTRKAMGWHR